MPKSASRVPDRKPWVAAGMSRTTWYRKGGTSRTPAPGKRAVASPGDKKRRRIANGTAPANPLVPDGDIQRRINDAVNEALTEKRVTLFLAGIERNLGEALEGEFLAVCAMPSTWRAVIGLIQRGWR